MERKAVSGLVDLDVYEKICAEAATARSSISVVVRNALTEKFRTNQMPPAAQSKGNLDEKLRSPVS